MSDPNDNSIPVLHEILVPGHAAQARQEAGGAAAPATRPAPEPEMPREPSFKAEPVLAPQPAHADEPSLPPEPVLAPQPVLAPEQTLAPEPVLAPEPAQAHKPTVAPEPALAPEAAHAAEPTHAAEPKLGPEPEPLHAAEHAHPKKRSRLHHGAEARHAHDHAQVLAGVFDRAEPAAPLEAGAIVPPDIARETEAAALSQADLDADVIAERLRGRFAGFLTGEGRGIIEARCRDALQEHTTLLVSQITREVALTLETEMTGWVREAVEEEIARRSGHG
ncbi:hypothetical protein LMG28614_03188 [Paraburkholderia ultramafica]|uniref:DUF2486 domain-containing protein n=1 Tax=Paraburkholderia ultramafica TaxID=1544867 RepID=A0A6S7B7X4_9BURK|nr:DUF2486 family protein [Paraburkholderia ultramafica]CAB3790890.1 hypothetical protein LMG28614_03188 [Paraburkholderia ultramafica]